jgi:hypothetical protein
MDDLSRRRFMGLLPAVAAFPTVGSVARQETAPPSNDDFPRHDPALAREIVGASHANLARVKELVTVRPTLARAAWDWGFGDWETALGAASHVGSKEIAAVLLSAGAHPTIFSAAMLGQLEAVKAFVGASPGIQKTRGPHGITLLAHARAGESTEVVRYLEALGDADSTYPNEPITDEDVEGLLGTYSYGPGQTQKLVVGRNRRGLVVVKREGDSDRNLFHHGQRVFNPAGAEAVRVRFEPVQGRATTMTIVDGRETLRASR